ncbi:hypothetical protein ACM66B_006510 [Microbotryomycetes sp. NB124-2]
MSERPCVQSAPKTVPALYQKPSLNLELTSNTVIVQPNSTIEAASASDSLLTGIVHLTLPTKRRVKAIKVELFGHGNVFAGNYGVSNTVETLRKTVSIKLAGQEFEAGQHSFEFMIIVPSNTATHMQCHAGRVRHHVRATLDFADSYLSSSISSHPTTVFITAGSPTTNAQDLDSTEIFLAHNHETLGLVEASFYTPHLAISGLVHAKLTFQALPEDVEIVKLESWITQKHVIVNTNGETLTPLAKKVKLLPTTKRDCWRKSSVQSTPCASRRLAWQTGSKSTTTDLDGDDGNDRSATNFEQLLRLPSDKFVRPTSLEGTDFAVIVSHVLTTELTFRQGGGDVQVFSIGKDVVLTSCRCQLESLVLPRYAEKQHERKSQQQCYCTVGDADLLEGDFASLLQHFA